MAQLVQVRDRTRCLRVDQLEVAGQSGRGLLFVADRVGQPEVHDRVVPAGVEALEGRPGHQRAAVVALAVRRDGQAEADDAHHPRLAGGADAEMDRVADADAELVGQPRAEHRLVGGGRRPARQGREPQRAAQGLEAVHGGALATDDALLRVHQRGRLHRGVLGDPFGVRRPRLGGDLDRAVALPAVPGRFGDEPHEAGREGHRRPRRRRWPARPSPPACGRGGCAGPPAAPRPCGGRPPPGRGGWPASPARS